MLTKDVYRLALKMFDMGACLMWNINELINGRSGFIGVISSYISENELNLFKEYIKNNFVNDGGLVYVCSSSIKEQCLQFLNELDKDLKKLININRLVLISRDEYIVNRKINMDKLINRIAMEIARLSEIIADKKTCVYICVDSFWNSLNLRKVREVYIKLRELYNAGKANFIIRYIVEDIDNPHIIPILQYHDYLIVDGVDNFEAYTPEELVHKALTLLSEKHSINYKCYKAMMRNEYLENMEQSMAGIIHDINNLLVSILGYAQYSLQIDDMNEIRKGLEVISRLALDGSCITKKVKSNFKRSFETQKDIYKFNYIVENCLDMVKHKFKSLTLSKTKNLELSVSLDSKNYIYTNEYDLRHSINNIIQNGIEAMEDRGILTVRTYDEGDNIVLEISDTGCGIDERLMNHVFKPYFTTKGARGTGLGLSIAKKIFEEHGGKIYIDSKVGEGTKFTIYFPAIKFDESVAEKKQEVYNTD